MMPCMKRERERDREREREKKSQINSARNTRIVRVTLRSHSLDLESQLTTAMKD